MNVPKSVRWITTPDSFYTYFVRGLLFSSTSFAALLAGWLIQTRAKSARDLYVLGLAAAASALFFMCYSECFPSPVPSTAEQDNPGIRRAATTVFPLIVLLTYGILISYALFNDYLFLTFNVGAIAVQVLLYLGYGYFLWRRSTQDILPAIRHQLVWSAIISISLSLYIGLTYDNSLGTWQTLAPVVLTAVALILISSFHLSKYYFLGIGLTFLALTILADWLITDELLRNALIAMQFCVIIGAYLAIIEAMKVTSDLALGEKYGYDTGEGESTKFSTATLSALGVAIWALPLLFIFLKYGSLFLFLFGVHSITSFLLWYFGGRESGLIRLPWGILKNVLGVLFLLLMVITAVYDLPLTSEYLRKPMSEWQYGLLLLLVSVPAGRFLVSVFRAPRLSRIFKRRVQVSRLLSSLCFVTAIILLYVLDVETEASPYYAKTKSAYLFYQAILLVCLIIEGVELVMPKLRRGRVNTGSLTLAFLTLIRIVPTCLIGLVVFLPALKSSGNIFPSLLVSLPFFLAAAGGFALNDFFDVEKDLVNKPYRPLPKGILSPKFVLVFAILTLATALLLSLVLSENYLQLILYIGTILGVSTYNVFVRYLSLSKTFITAAVSSFPLLFSVVSFGYHVNYFLVPIATCFFVLGREWMMDIRDAAGDARVGLKTLPIILGTPTAYRLAIFAEICAVYLLVLFAINLGSEIVWICVTALAATIFIVHLLWSTRDGQLQRRLIQGLWISMFLGIVLLVV